MVLTITATRSGMVRGGVVSFLSIFLLSSTGLLLFLPSSSHAFRTAPFVTARNVPSAAKRSSPRSREWRHSNRHTAAAGASEPESYVDDGRSLWTGMGGVERARLAESIAGEFGARVEEVRETYDARLRQEKASHRVQLAEQKVNLLQVRMLLLVFTGVLGGGDFFGGGGGGGDGDVVLLVRCPLFWSPMLFVHVDTEHRDKRTIVHVYYCSTSTINSTRYTTVVVVLIVVLYESRLLSVCLSCG